MNHLFKTVYNNGDFKPIVNIYKQYDDCLVEEQEIFGNRVMIQSLDKSEAEMLIRFFPKDSITIARMSVNHTRKGIGSKILDYIIKYAKDNQLKNIYIESILSKEMISLAKKYKFTPVKSLSYEMHDDIYGTYGLSLESLN